MTEAEVAEDAPGQDVLPGTDAGSGRSGRGSDPWSREQVQQAVMRHQWLLHAAVLVCYSLLAAAGAAARLLIVPGAAAGAGAWIVVTGVRALLARRASRAAGGQGELPPGAWQPGQPPPEGVPDATAVAAARVLGRAVASGRWQGAWLLIARCTDPVRHGQCQEAYSLSCGQMIGVVLGEHIAGRAGFAAFALAHEARHQAAWARRLNAVAVSAQPAAWLVAGWAVPWPWLPAVLVAVQAARTAALWATELGCDVGGARAEGRDGALGFLAALNGELRRSKATRQTWAIRALIIAQGGGYPPWQLRSAIIRACIRHPREKRPGRHDGG
jgi:hypothetical protein